MRLEYVDWLFGDLRELQGDDLRAVLEWAVERPVLAVHRLADGRILALVEGLGWLLYEYHEEWEAWDEVVAIMDGYPIYEDRVAPPGAEWEWVPEEEALGLLQAGT